MSQHRRSRVATLQHASESTDTFFAMALLWVIPVIAFLLTLTRF